ncbi:YchJ family protein [Pantoea allii]|uniref:YchJ family protein n=1 Tax=Pantoea allii TaxID=574096 RepID=UPI0024B8237B|nr:YchJ family protein [Pantoea allii]MDJ0036897.1 YchJ family protein [Pantoea allii]
MSESCPCCSGKQYSLCCQPFVKGTEIPLSAEQLMRSRYCAYVKHDVDYLVSTWHPTRCDPALAGLLSERFAGTEWLSLNVTHCEPGRNQDEAFVTFFARYRENGVNRAMYERSRFLREDQRWYYVDGITPAIGRNDRCPCGADKKYKKCCG